MLSLSINYNTPVDVKEFEKEVNRILAEVEEECGWMYTTLHNPLVEKLVIWTATAKSDSIDTLKKLIAGNTSSMEFRSDQSDIGRINYTI